MADDKFADLVQDFAKDPEKEKGGVWMPYGHFEYLIARAHRNNTKFIRLMEEKLRPYKWAIDRNDFDAVKDAASEAMQAVYAESVLLRVRRLDTKVVLETTAQERFDLFRRVPDLWDEVFKFSGKDANYKPDVELDSGN